MSPRLGVRVADPLAVRDPEHLPHQVEPGDLLGDRVLDLQPGVHFEKGDGAAGAYKELARASPHVPGLAEDRLGGLVEHPDLLGAEERRGRLLDQFLMAALE